MISAVIFERFSRKTGSSSQIPIVYISVHPFLFCGAAQIGGGNEDIVLYFRTKNTVVFFRNAFHDGNSVAVSGPVGLAREKPAARGAQQRRIEGILTAEVEKIFCLPDGQGKPPLPGRQMGIGLKRVVQQIGKKLAQIHVLHEDRPRHPDGIGNLYSRGPGFCPVIRQHGIEQQVRRIGGRLHLRVILRNAVQVAGGAVVVAVLQQDGKGGDMVPDLVMRFPDLSLGVRQEPVALQRGLQRGIFAGMAARRLQKAEDDVAEEQHQNLHGSGQKVEHLSVRYAGAHRDLIEKEQSREKDAGDHGDPFPDSRIDPLVKSAADMPQDIEHGAEHETVEQKVEQQSRGAVHIFRFRKGRGVGNQLRHQKTVIGDQDENENFMYGFRPDAEQIDRQKKDQRQHEDQVEREVGSVFVGNDVQFDIKPGKNGGHDGQDQKQERDEPLPGITEGIGERIKAEKSAGQKLEPEP